MSYYYLKYYENKEPPVADLPISLGLAAICLWILLRVMRKKK